MPTTYAHYAFGKQVYHHLDNESRSLIDQHPSLFLVGLHGPDILFYYHPLKENSVVKLGHEIHRRTATFFFNQARKQLGHNPDPEGGVAYLMGFFCHYMLDSECHPLVRKATGENKAEHNKLEKEFDRVMMIRENQNPLSYKPTGHLVLNPGDPSVISGFYPGVTAIQIEEAVRGMKLLLEILVTPTRCRHLTMKIIFRMIGRRKNFESLLMSMEPIPGYIQCSDALADCLSQAVEPTAALANELFKSLHGKEAAQTFSDGLLRRLNRNFG